MRFTVAALALVASVDYSAAFAPSFPAKVAVSKQTPLFSTVETATDTTESPASTDVPEANGAAAPAATGGLSASDINARLEKQLAKLKEKDSTSPELKKEVSGAECACSDIRFHRLDGYFFLGKLAPFRQWMLTLLVGAF